MDQRFTDAQLKCPKCEKGYMLPVEDSFSQVSTLVGIKGYVCTECNNNFFYHRSGLITYKIVEDKQLTLQSSFSLGNGLDKTNR
jgi:transposase-like protein